MRVKNGMFEFEEGVSFLTPESVYECRSNGTEVIIGGLVPDGLHADKLNGTLIICRISSPGPDVFRLRMQHHLSIETVGSRYLAALPELPLEVREDEDEYLVSNGTITIVFVKSSWEYRIIRNDSDTPAATVFPNESSGVLFQKDRKFITTKFSFNVGELAYGLGERFGPFVKNGQHIEIWNTDAATESDFGYKNFPFLMTNQGLGVFVNHTGRTDFEIATEDNNAVRFSVEGNELDYFLMKAFSPREALTAYSALVGRPAFIPKWSLGLWLTTSFTTDYNERSVLEHVDRMREEGIQLSVFHFDCFWMKERHWCNFQWDLTAFPDPQGLLDKLRARGIKTCLWINPYISEISEIYEEAALKGYLLKKADGSIYQIDWWQPGNAFVDFSNPEAVSWYKGLLRNLLDMGVNTFKTDFGESAPEDAVYYNGVPGNLMHNRYAVIYNQTVFELLEEYYGKGKAVVFARSSAPGGQQYPVHWGGDSQANFASMSGQLRGGLSFGLSGGAFWSHDIGGFFGKPDPALYKRWIAFGLFSSHSRLHGNESLRVPWSYDDESVEVLRFFTRLRHSLMPYIESTCREASNTGLPVLRSMMLEFPEDPICSYLDRQYMFGGSLLVAPVFSGGNTAGFYLPKGRWTNLLTGEIVDGGSWRTEEHDFFSLPLYVRPDSIIPRCNEEAKADADCYDDLYIELYEIEAGGTVEFTSSGEVRLSIKPAAEGISVESSIPITLTIREMDTGKSGKMVNDRNIVIH